MISDICQTAIDKNPDRTKVEDIHNQCSGILLVAKSAAATAI